MACDGTIWIFFPLGRASVVHSTVEGEDLPSHNVDSRRSPEPLYPEHHTGPRLPGGNMRAILAPSGFDRLVDS